MIELDDVVAAILQLPRAEVDDQCATTTVATWTSLKHIQLIVELERSYGVEITAREARRLRTVGQIRAFLRAKGLMAG
jgi:acyl carrier protein